MDFTTQTLPTTPSVSGEADVSWGIALRFWWAWMWRSVLAAFGSGFVIGFIIGFVGAAMGAPEGAVTILSSLVGLLIGVFFSLFFMRRLLKKDFGSFKVMVVRK